MRVLFSLLVFFFIGNGIPNVQANSSLMKFLQDEFNAKKQKIESNDSKPCRKVSPQKTHSNSDSCENEQKFNCPSVMPDYVCEIIKYLSPQPFTYEQEKKAKVDPVARRKVRQGLLDRIKGFRDHIKDASRIFNVPESLIISVVNAESSGNPRAKNPLSSAKGLMQTIDSTFEMAKKSLQRDYGIYISYPYDPRSSILAGTWYLRYVFDWAAEREPGLSNNSSSLDNWDKALMNYYLGPGHKKYLQGKLVIYPGGHIEKISTAQKYVNKIITFAETVSG